MYRFALAFSLAIMVSACGSAPVGNDTLGMRNRSVLTMEEIQAARAPGRNAHDLISQLRPEYMRTRGVTSMRTPEPSTATVYVDGMRYGELESLKSLPATQVIRVEYINAADATTRFGTDHVGGAILVSTK